MNQADVLKILSDVGAIITNSHIVYTSGKHGDSYVNKDAVYPHTRATSQLCLSIAMEFKDLGVDVVVAPAIGAVILSQWIAFHLTNLTDREVLAVYAEKDDDRFVIKRGYDRLIDGKNILVVEDVLTTGGSVRKVVEACRNSGAHVLGVGALCNRGDVQAKDIGSVPVLHSLVEVNLSAWDEASCPLCERKVPVNTGVGKGREFLAKSTS
jgi:orotate phosphoribosyltransferase